MPSALALPSLAVLRDRAVNGEARRIRVAARIRLTEVAARIGVDPATLSRWERGIGSPRGEEAARWSRVLEDLERAVPA